MKKIMIVVLLLSIMGCTSLNDRELKVLTSPTTKEEVKAEKSKGKVEVKFVGDAVDIYFEGDSVILNKVYYVMPGEYRLVWNSRGYFEMSVESGGRRGNSDHSDSRMRHRNNEEITISKDSLVEITPFDAKVIEK